MHSVCRQREQKNSLWSWSEMLSCVEREGRGLRHLRNERKCEATIMDATPEEDAKMKEFAGPCPIKTAIKATNKGNALRTAKRLYRQRWDLRRDEDAQERFRDGHWKTCGAELRRIFKAEFRHPRWRALSWIEFPVSVGQENGITKEVDFFMNYRCHWHGMFFSRCFYPKSREDVVAEAWRLAGVLLAWKEIAEETR